MAERNILTSQDISATLAVGMIKVDKNHYTNSVTIPLERRCRYNVDKRHVAVCHFINFTALEIMEQNTYHLPVHHKCCHNFMRRGRVRKDRLRACTSLFSDYTSSTAEMFSDSFQG